jgi:hypothetical protein
MELDEKGRLLNEANHYVQLTRLFDEDDDWHAEVSRALASEIDRRISLPLPPARGLAPPCPLRCNLAPSPRATWHRLLVQPGTIPSCNLAPSPRVCGIPLYLRKLTMYECVWTRASNCQGQH